jgi:hypothetical protein
MILNVVKSREDRNGDGDGENENESGSEGFGNEDEDYDYNYQRRPYSLDYAKIIEEYYHSNLSHTPRRLIIMF